MIKRSSGTLTIGDAFKLFKTSKNDVQKVTMNNYELSFELFLRDNGIEENFPLCNITNRFFEHWVNSSERSISAKNHHLVSMRVFLYWCMKQGYLERYQINKLKYQMSAPRFYTDDELELLVKKPSKSELFSQYRTYVLICFILATGARASTLTNIKMSDISFSNHEIIYRHLKNRHTAVIPLSKSLEKVLREYLSVWQREKEDGYLFCDMNERQSTVSALYQSMENYCRRRGVESKGLHALRHSFAREYIINGGNAFKLQRILTHSDMSMTKRYVRLFDSDLQNDYFSPLDSYKNQGRISRK